MREKSLGKEKKSCFPNQPTFYWIEVVSTTQVVPIIYKDVFLLPNNINGIRHVCVRVCVCERERERGYVCVLLHTSSLRFLWFTHTFYLRMNCLGLDFTLLQFTSVLTRLVVFKNRSSRISLFTLFFLVCLFVCLL